VAVWSNADEVTYLERLNLIINNMLCESSLGFPFSGIGFYGSVERSKKKRRNTRTRIRGLLYKLNSWWGNDDASVEHA